tara:strand:- start:253 stop:378 length:126 start_codon:yes stop_codon:yes gene_type:complete
MQKRQKEQQALLSLNQTPENLTKIAKNNKKFGSVYFYLYFP